MFTREYADAQDLIDGLTDHVAWASKNELDVATSSKIVLNDVFVKAEQFTWEEDLKTWWMHKQRFTTLTRQYLNPETLDIWLDSIEAKLSKKRAAGVAVMRTNMIGVRRNKGAAGASWRTWGACILSLSYRAAPTPQITMHSRSCYLGFLSVLDMSVAYQAARLIAERVGIDVSDISFLWHIEAAQLHPFKSLPIFLRNEDTVDFLINGNNQMVSPAFIMARKAVSKIFTDDDAGLSYGDVVFAQYRRARKRFHTEVMGYDYGEPFSHGNHADNSQNIRFKPLPHVGVDDMSFDTLYKKYNVQEDPALLVEMVDE